MIRHRVRVHRSADNLPRYDQLAWKIAEVAAGARDVDPDVRELVACRVVDNAAVALASVARRPVASARAMALTHPRPHGATLFGLGERVRVHCEWAAWANATAVRELDYHDTFLAADYAHPADSIPPLIAVAQQTGRTGAELVRAVAVAYEVHVALVKAMCLHAHKKDHVAHLAPATVAGIGALLELPPEVVYQAVNQAVHLAFSTRQSRKGEISSWKACVPGFSGKLAIEAVDRAMRGEASPSPIYEGEDSVIAWMLGGPDAAYEVALPRPGDPPRAILETYTKAHSAEYQAQALIDLAIELAPQVEDFGQVEEVVVETSHHTHTVIGTGANDPQKFDPDASRETLDHSLMYILTVAFEDRAWHYERSYASERAHRPSTVALWQRIRTREDAAWTARYHDPDPARRSFGGRISIRLRDGGVIAGEKAVADAHPNGASPWTWEHYVAKFDALTSGVIEPRERDRFLADANRIADLGPAHLVRLNPALPAGVIDSAPTGEGIFDFGLRGADRSRAVGG